ncbi:MAG TPA: VWA domain-containing protein [Pyrinomonadaceae bacterium]|nr:VWA domain-containing protein [Pyrinomonadaceae bacterium]
MFLAQLALLFRVFLLGLVSCLPFLGAGSSRAAERGPHAGCPRGVLEDDGVRIDVPAAARVRIENQFGPVAAEVWKEKYVSVSASIEGTGARFTRSPIVIENRAKLLVISVIRTPVDPRAGITLTVKLPEGSHTEIVTGVGSISMRGVLASASLKSDSGDIRAELSHPLNADISARTTNGTIRSELGAPLSGGGHVLQTRFGTGDYVLRIATERGEITVALDSTLNDGTTEVSGPPRLLGSENISKGAGTPANPTDSEEISEGDVIRVDSQLATLNLSVIDRNTNRGVLGLTQSDFRLFEDGIEQRLLQFESASAPFDLILLIDVSGSTRDVVKLIRAAALRFVDKARPSDRIGIISFAGHPTVISPVTLDREVLRQRVNAIDTATGDTKAYDAIDFSLTHLLKSTAGSPSGPAWGRKNTRRTAIVMMSDGLDGSIPGVQGDGSKLPYGEMLSRVREFDGVLYTLWLNTEYEALNPLDTQPEAFDMGYDRMKELAEAGGGVFYEVERLQDLAGAYERVVADLGTVYSLAYRPTNKTRDGKWRAVRVTLNRPTAVARGKHGYYAN